MTPSECKYQIVPAIPLVFVDAGEDLVMADDVITPSNPPIAPIEKEKLKETSLDMNVSQQPCNEKPFRKMMHIQIDRSAWDRRLSPNPHALVIYLKFVPVCGVAPERFEECQCENDDVCFYC